ncbi:hypothetical protein EON65_28900 [archaeon]|nr:MAG: hypothetical protein EON65_28900 [archaeon]
MELPTPALLQRRPYKRQASLISNPMKRNIVIQCFYQLILLLILLFSGAQMFGVVEGLGCFEYNILGSNKLWNVDTTKIDGATGTFSCDNYKDYCGDEGYECFHNEHTIIAGGTPYVRTIADFEDFEAECLECKKLDYTHTTLIFNTFIFCQVFNEYNARSIFDDWNMFANINKNPTFIMVTIITIGFQILLVELGGKNFRLFVCVCVFVCMRIV